MAQLQGYFLSHKDDPYGAFEDLQRRAKSQSDSSVDLRPLPPPPLVSQQQRQRSPPSSTGRRISAHELDKMPFNPQHDWEKDIAPQK
jgi:hypothetical protein